MDEILRTSGVPDGGVTLNPFVVVEDAAGYLGFLADVFGAVENEAARTPTPDGRLIHAEVRMGPVTLMMSDPMDGWPTRPGLLQVWVRDVDRVLGRGAARGATTVTPASPFYGETTLGRMADPWGTLWWLYAEAPGQPDPTPAWEGGSDVVFSTIDAHMKGLRG